MGRWGRLAITKANCNTNGRAPNHYMSALPPLHNLSLNTPKIVYENNPDVVRSLLDRSLEFVEKHDNKKELINAIQRYTGRDYSSVNSIMRMPDNQGTVLFDTAGYLQIGKMLNSALESAPITTNELTLWRGVGDMDWFDAECGRTVPASLFTERALLSCTTDFTTALSNAGDRCCLMQIRVPKGKRMLDVSAFSEHGDEKEILMGNQTQLRCLSKSEVELDPKFSSVSTSVPVTLFTFMDSSLPPNQRLETAKRLYEAAKARDELTRTVTRSRERVQVAFLEVV